MSDTYTLGPDGKTPVPCDMTTWGLDLEKNRRVAADDLSEDIRVSTVFLGLDHRHGEGSPLLFETMIFGGPHHDYQERYSTWDEAVEGHARAVALAKGAL